MIDVIFDGLDHASSQQSMGRVRSHHDGTVYDIVTSGDRTGPD